MPKRLTTKEFIEKAYKIHNNQYDYSKLNTCIEYDGKHHFGIGRFARKSVQINDKIKNEYCQENNIRLVRIPYWKTSNYANVFSI